MQRPKLETPGALAIMLIYLAVFLVMWVLAFAFLSGKWAIR